VRVALGGPPNFVAGPGGIPGYPVEVAMMADSRANARYTSDLEGTLAILYFDATRTWMRLHVKTFEEGEHALVEELLGGGRSWMRASVECPPAHPKGRQVPFIGVACSLRSLGLLPEVPTHPRPGRAGPLANVGCARSGRGGAWECYRAR